MTRSPQSDAAANGPNAKEELYLLACRLERERDEARGALSEIAFYLSMGMGDETTTAEQYKQRIHDGIKMLTDPIVNLWKQAERERDEAREAFAIVTNQLVQAQADLRVAREVAEEYAPFLVKLESWGKRYEKYEREMESIREAIAVCEKWKEATK